MAKTFIGNIKGPKGDKGDKGDPGTGGSSSTDVESYLDSHTATDSEIDTMLNTIWEE